MHALIAQAAEAAQSESSLMIGVAVSTVFSVMAGICSATVVWYLRGIAARVEKVETQVQRLAMQKIECQRDFVGTESWVRSEGYTRQQLDKVVQSLAALEAKTDIARAMSEAVASFARESKPKESK